MTYGVDECRVCGVAIKPSGPDALKRHNISLKGRPVMTERQWRAAGFKACPTYRQTKEPTDGCCSACKLKMHGRTWKPRRRFAMVLGFAVAFLGLTYLGLAWFTPY
jgi:hypothetical protein